MYRAEIENRGVRVKTTTNKVAILMANCGFELPRLAFTKNHKDTDRISSVSFNFCWAIVGSRSPKNYRDDIAPNQLNLLRICCLSKKQLVNSLILFIDDETTFTTTSIFTKVLMTYKR
jgi:hypothetical protein